MSKGIKRKNPKTLSARANPPTEKTRSHTRQHNSNSIWTRHRDIIICQVLVLICIAIYAQVRRFEFISLDDGSYVYENPNVTGGMTLQAFRWAWTSFHSTNWHPLTWLSHILDVQLFGLNAGMHHLTSVVFHILNAVLLFVVCKRMTSATWRSAFVAALFAVHPLHVESVAWVAERKDVFSTFFWLLTMLAYVRYSELSTSWKRYLLVMLCLVLGLLAKPMLVTLPFVLLLLDYWPLKRLEWLPGDGVRKFMARAWPLITEKIPLVLLATASSVVTFFAQKSGGAVRSLETYPLKLRITNSFVSYLTYVAKMFWPVNLGVWYPYERNLPWWYGVLAAVLLFAITTVVLRAALQRGYLLTGWFWFLGTLIPVIGLVQVGAQALADRYTYVPLIGLFIIVAWGGVELAERFGMSRSVLAAVAVAVILILSLLSWKQVSYWQNNETIYTHTISVTKDNWLAQHNLCVGLANLDRPDEALPHCEETLRILPTHLEAVNSLGFALLKQSRYAEAAKYFLHYLQTRQDEPRVYLNLVVALSALGKTSEAAHAMAEAERLDPTHKNGPPRYVLALAALAEAFANEKRFAEAESYAQQALLLDPNSSDAQAAVGLILLQQGRLEEAFNTLTEAVRLNPRNSTAHNNLGLVLAAQGKQRDAAMEFATALKLNPHNINAQANLRKTQPALETQKR